MMMGNLEFWTGDRNPRGINDSAAANYDARQQPVIQCAMDVYAVGVVNSRE